VKAKIILNPYANRWRAQSQKTLVEQVCRDAGLDFDLSITTGPRNGSEEAQTAVSNGYDMVVAAGGDGTVSEVVNGLIAAAGDGPTHPLGVLPIGTGNDFNDMSGLPRDLTEAAGIIAAGQSRSVDAGLVTIDGTDHYFDNNCALAMEPMVTIENLHIKRLSGNIRYVVATLKALLKLSAWDMDFTWDDGHYSGPIYLLSICNSRRTGGIFNMAPNARMDDGLFDFVFVPKVPKSKVISLVPRLLNGSHIGDSDVTHGRTTKLVVESQPGTPLHADGEVMAEAAHRLQYQILPGKITLLSPA
jgi:diacylglycerol kinase (ATP)